LFVTDLDGSLLDDSYDFEPARAALEALAAAGAVLVLASSKTRAEMEPLAARLGSRPPLIAENGGAVLLPHAGGGYESIARSVPHARLLVALREIARETGAAISGFTSLGASAVADLTGLGPAATALAMAREHDEPFVLGDAEHEPAVAAAAERRGLRVTRGGRFFHLTGTADKGSALRALMARLGRPRETVGLGDAFNDLPLLRETDRAIVIPRADGSVDPALASALPAAERAPAPGPVGWNAAVLAVLAGERLPGAASGSDS
jgi:mannosyl-3-phosphoglycerate phosphatase